MGCPRTVLQKSDTRIHRRNRQADHPFMNSARPSGLTEIAARPAALSGEWSKHDLHEGGAHQFNIELGRTLKSLLNAATDDLQAVQCALNDRTGCGEPVSSAARETALRRLDSAALALRQMSETLEHIVEVPRAELDVFEPDQTLSEHIRAIVGLLSSDVARHGIDLVTDLTPKAAALPAGILGYVIFNGLRAAVDACIASAQEYKRVELSIAIKPSGHLVVLISDNVERISPDSAAELVHGHGDSARRLDSCRSLVERLGGTLRWVHVPFGGGTILQVVVGLGNLTKHG
jgi:hypothetical protein